MFLGAWKYNFYSENEIVNFHSIGSSKTLNYKKISWEHILGRNWDNFEKYCSRGLEKQDLLCYDILHFHVIPAPKTKYFDLVSFYAMQKAFSLDYKTKWQLYCLQKTATPRDRPSFCGYIRYKLFVATLGIFMFAENSLALGPPQLLWHYQI